ncbi:DUF6446 family protein [Rhodobacteraceae bacterium XHP0102]|nr:DUF6446 family protein [Rhodobacteraceae bacterium XHP0102]
MTNKTKGRLVVAAIALSALAAGAGMWYAQTRAFYAPVMPDDPRAQITVTVGDRLQPLAISGFDGIDSNSSPIRYRACFAVDAGQEALLAEAERYAAASPLVAPAWFGCFDAEALGAAIEEGRATAYLGQRDFIYGVDVVVARDAQGRGYAWRQINPCGEAAFNGDPLPEGCPPYDPE